MVCQAHIFGGITVHSKNENQYYAEAFETSVCEKLGVEDLPQLELSCVSESDMRKIEQDAEKMSDEIRRVVGAGKYEYIGRETGSQLGDIIGPQGERIELKYIGGKGKGTYHNTSVSYFNDLGCTPYNDFLRANGYYDFLREELPKGIVPNEKAASPVTMQESHVIRHEYPDAAKRIAEEEKRNREKYVQHVCDTIGNRDLVATVIDDMLGKIKTRDGEKKGIPNFLFIYDYNSDKINVLTSEELCNLCSDKTNINNQGLGLLLGGFMRLQIGWQNGNGLNNPTIRVFVENNE